MHSLNCFLKLLQSKWVSFLDVVGDFRFFVLHFHLVNQIRDREETDAASNWLEHLHPGQVALFRIVLESLLTHQDRLNHVLKHVIGNHPFLNLSYSLIDSNNARSDFPSHFHVLFFSEFIGPFAMIMFIVVVFNVDSRNKFFLQTSIGWFLNGLGKGNVFDCCIF